MDRWNGKVVVVTGASGGIGAAVCIALANHGVRVVGLARRTNLVDKLQASVKGPGSITSYNCDLAKPRQISDAFRWIEDRFGCVHGMVNNAGVFFSGQITEAGESPLNEDSIHSIIDINLKAPVLCTRHAVASMKKHSFEGHIITINSIAGHYVPLASNFNVYPSSKHAITAFMRSLTGELCHYKSFIKTTSISPGLVATDMAGNVTDLHMRALDAKDVADAVVYALSTPPTVNIEELTITPVGGKRL